MTKCFQGNVRLSFQAESYATWIAVPPHLPNPIVIHRISLETLLEWVNTEARLLRAMNATQVIWKCHLKAHPFHDKDSKNLHLETPLQMLRKQQPNKE